MMKVIYIQGNDGVSSQDITLFLNNGCQVSQDLVVLHMSPPWVKLNLQVKTIWLKFADFHQGMPQFDPDFSRSHPTTHFEILFINSIVMVKASREMVRPKNMSILIMDCF